MKTLLRYGWQAFNDTCGTLLELMGVDKAIDKMLFRSVSDVHLQGHDRWSCQFDSRTGRTAAPTHEQ
jgi:hypothetical protein